MDIALTKKPTRDFMGARGVRRRGRRTTGSDVFAVLQAYAVDHPAERPRGALSERGRLLPGGGARSAFHSHQPPTALQYAPAACDRRGLGGIRAWAIDHFAMA